MLAKDQVVALILDQRGEVDALENAQAKIGQNLGVIADFIRAADIIRLHAKRHVIYLNVPEIAHPFPPSGIPRLWERCL